MSPGGCEHLARFAISHDLLHRVLCHRVVVNSRCIFLQVRTRSNLCHRVVVNVWHPKAVTHQHVGVGSVCVQTLDSGGVHSTYVDKLQSHNGHLGIVQKSFSEKILSTEHSRHGTNRQAHLL